MLPVQRNLQRATELAVAAVTIQSDHQLRWLGPKPRTTLGGCPSSTRLCWWTCPPSGLPRNRVGRDPALAHPHATLPGNRIASRPAATRDHLRRSRHGPILRQGVPERAIARLCAWVGRDSARLVAAARGLGACAVAVGDAAFDFDVFPRLTLRLVWYAGDDELPPDATLLLPSNIEAYFTAEDVVVLSNGWCPGWSANPGRESRKRPLAQQEERCGELAISPSSNSRRMAIGCSTLSETGRQKRY